MSPRMPKTKRGYEPFEVVSALQKSVRRSDPDAALYWGAELFKSGYAAWAWRRLRVIMTEDVGPAMPSGMVADIYALKQFAAEATKHDKNLEGEFFHYAHALILLCKSPKTRIADNAYMAHFTDHVERREIPDYVQDVHTQAGRRLGRDWTHFVEESGRLIEPEKASESRGFDGMEDELDKLDEAYTEHFLAMNQGRVHELPSNPFGEQMELTPGTMKRGVQTHFVERPLGIPLEGTAQPKQGDDQ